MCSVVHCKIHTRLKSTFYFINKFMCTEIFFHQTLDFCTKITKLAHVNIQLTYSKKK